MTSQDQTISATAGATEYSYPRTITETTGKNITADTILVALGTYTTPGAWVTPDVITRPTTSTAVVQMLLTSPPTTGETDYWIWVKVSDSPEVVPRRTPGRIRFT